MKTRLLFTIFISLNFFSTFSQNVSEINDSIANNNYKGILINDYYFSGEVIDFKCLINLLGIDSLTVKEIKSVELLKNTENIYPHSTKQSETELVIKFKKKINNGIVKIVKEYSFWKDSKDCKIQIILNGQSFEDFVTRFDKIRHLDQNQILKIDYVKIDNGLKVLINCK
jgi:hypothetical protein